MPRLHGQCRRSVGGPVPRMSEDKVDQTLYQFLADRRDQRDIHASSRREISSLKPHRSRPSSPTRHDKRSRTRNARLGVARIETINAREDLGAHFAWVPRAHINTCRGNRRADDVKCRRSPHPRRTLSTSDPSLEDRVTRAFALGANSPSAPSLPCVFPRFSSLAAPCPTVFLISSDSQSVLTTARRRVMRPVAIHLTMPSSG